jgi:hypothetical protein
MVGYVSGKCRCKHGKEQKMSSTSGMGRGASKERVTRGSSWDMCGISG